MSHAAPRMPEPKNLIAGSWVPARSGKTIDVVSPSDGEIIASIADSGPDDIDAAVAAARKAYEGDWGRLTAVERGLEGGLLLGELGLGLDVDAPAGQAGGQTGVLALAADGKRQLVVGHEGTDGLGGGVEDEARGHLRRRQRVGIQICPQGEQSGRR